MVCYVWFVQAEIGDRQRRTRWLELLNGNEVFTPTDADSALAKESSRRLAAYLGHSTGVCLEVKAGTTSEQLALPPAALRLLLHVLTEMGQGNAVTLTPIRAD